MHTMADTASRGRRSRALPAAGYSSQAQLGLSRARVPRILDAIAATAHQEERDIRIKRGGCEP